MKYTLKIQGEELKNHPINKTLSANFERKAIIKPTSTRGKGKINTYEVEENDIVRIQFEDNTIWIAGTQDIPELFDNISESNIEFEIPNFITPKEKSTRGGIQSIIVKLVELFAPKAAKKGAKAIANKIESKITKEGLYEITPDFELKVPEDLSAFNNDKPILLLLHGTGSNTMCSFNGLKGSDAWNSLNKEYNTILTYEHKTWSQSPLQNALDLINNLPDNKELDFHILSFSRGGIVGDILCRMSKDGEPFSKLEIQRFDDLKREEDKELLKKLNDTYPLEKFNVTKHLRIGCPALGTTLLSNRVDNFLNIILNIVGNIPGIMGNPIFETIHECTLELLTNLVGQKNEIEVLPGLEAMRPESPIIDLLNNHLVTLESDLVVISGNAGLGNIKQSLSWIATRLFFRQKNDFVVDTKSMTGGYKRINSIYEKHINGKKIHHFQYFDNPDSQKSIVAALKYNSSDLPSDFKPINSTGTRGISRIVPGGNAFIPKSKKSNKGYVILIPGIMGSNLKTDTDEIWINFRKMATGGLSKLKHDATNIEAHSLVKSYYQKFANFLHSNGYNVIDFPFDWRLSTSKAAKELNKVIKDVLEKKAKNQSINIVAHSMGGIVVRQLMMDNNATWDKLNALKDFNCILLGTPWKGSYLIPEVLTGLGKRIKMIATIARFSQTKKELLQMFVQCPGILELMPLYGHKFEDPEIWKLIEYGHHDSSWQIPSQKELTYFENYKKSILSAKFNLSKVIYIAGQKDKTTANFSFKPRFGSEISGFKAIDIKSKLGGKPKIGLSQYKLTFQTTNRGDGSVTWASGIPDGISRDENFYFMPTEHGELANDSKYFYALLDIIKTGKTEQLLRQLPVSRSGEIIEDQIPDQIISNDEVELLRGMMGLETSTYYEEDNSTLDDPEITISLKNGDLKYSTFPLMIGHFQGDAIVSAEGVMNDYLDNKLSERNDLGNYPGPINSNLILLESDENELGAIIIGLGYPENLTPALLSKSVETACIEYAVRIRDTSPNQALDKVGVSSLFVGSGYAELPLHNAISSILEGIKNANRKIISIGNKIPIIEELEFVELFEDISYRAFNILKIIEDEQNIYKIKINGKIQTVEGKRMMLPYGFNKSWWKRIRAVSRKVNEEDYIHFSASTRRATVQERGEYPDMDIIFDLLEETSRHGQWDREVAKPLFELLIPNDFKIAFKNRQNLLLVLDKVTANFPWELLHYDDKGDEPICVSAGMIRQLATINDDLSRVTVDKNSALIIGDPKLGPNSNFNQLPGAAKEAKTVNELLIENGYTTTPLINESVGNIVKKLFNEYKIVHIASHGVIDFEPKNKEGILIGSKTVITTRQLNKWNFSPDFVFLNCCHLGNIDAAKEETFRKKYNLAASMGAQLIENGVKAVIVAGWEVDDASAQVFAETFYQKFLNGFSFADSVLAARKACYEFNSSNNTWGAYQCYGNPHFKIQRKRTYKNNNEYYLTEKDALKDLEILINYSSSSRKRPRNLLRELEQLVKKIEVSGLKSTLVYEKVALAYDLLGDEANALAYFEILFASENANYSLKSLERYFNLNAKYYSNQSGKNALGFINKSINGIHNLIQLADKTSERYSILASTYKRKFMIDNSLGTLQEMTHYYKKSSEMKPNKLYPCINWLKGKYFLEEKVTQGKIMELRNRSIKEFLIQKEAEAMKKAKTKKGLKEFWDWVEIVNINQCKLLYFPSERESIEKVITDSYYYAWKLGGAKSHLNSEIEQFKFLLLGAELKKNKKLIMSIKKLIDHFKKIK